MYTAAVRDVVGWGYTTVVKRLERLERGGAVESRDGGRGREWRLAAPRDQKTPHRASPARVPGVRTADELDDGLAGAPDSEVVTDDEW